MAKDLAMKLFDGFAFFHDLIITKSYSTSTSSSETDKDPKIDDTAEKA